MVILLLLKFSILIIVSNLKYCFCLLHTNVLTPEIVHDSTHKIISFNLTYDDRLHYETCMIDYLNIPISIANIMLNLKELNELKMFVSSGIWRNPIWKDSNIPSFLKNGGTTLIGTYNYPINNTSSQTLLLSSSWKKIRSYANDLFDIAINNEESKIVPLSRINNNNNNNNPATISQYFPFATLNANNFMKLKKIFSFPNNSSLGKIADMRLLFNKETLWSGYELLLSRSTIEKINYATALNNNNHNNINNKNDNNTIIIDTSTTYLWHIKLSFKLYMVVSKISPVVALSHDNDSRYKSNNNKKLRFDRLVFDSRQLGFKVVSRILVSTTTSATNATTANATTFVTQDCSEDKDDSSSMLSGGGGGGVDKSNNYCDISSSSTSETTTTVVPVNFLLPTSRSLVFYEVLPDHYDIDWSSYIYNVVSVKNNISLAHGHLNDISNISYTTTSCITFSNIKLHTINNLKNSDYNGGCFRIISFEIKIPSNDNKDDIEDNVDVSILLTYQATKRLLTRHSQAIDASRGVLVPPSFIKLYEKMIFTNPNSNRNLHTLIVSEDMNEYTISPKRIDTLITSTITPIITTVTTEIESSQPFLLLSPIPDASMPYNVMTLVSTILAFFMGSLINALVRRK